MSNWIFDYVLTVFNVVRFYLIYLISIKNPLFTAFSLKFLVTFRVPDPFLMLNYFKTYS